MQKTFLYRWRIAMAYIVLKCKYDQIWKGASNEVSNLYQAMTMDHGVRKSGFVGQNRKMFLICNDHLS